MEASDFDKTLDLKKIKPYGDTMNDGKTQLSFTLPVPCGDEAIEAAKQLMKKMGFENPQVAYYKELTEGFTFFNCYGTCSHTVDFTTIKVTKVESTTWDMHETDDYIKEHVGRKIVVVGASTGTDAHTVGIDAIMNMKGFDGHYGLERYHGIKAYNLGAQVPNEELIAKAGLATVLTKNPETALKILTSNLYGELPQDYVEFMRAKRPETQFVAGEFEALLRSFIPTK